MSFRCLSGSSSLEGMELTRSFEAVVPAHIRQRYEFIEVRNAAAVMQASNPDEFCELLGVLEDFNLYTSDLLTPGGQESQIPKRLNGAFRTLGWREARVDTMIRLSLKLSAFGGEPIPDPMVTEVVNEGYMVDNFKSKVALDVEWNAKDGNLDRDIAAYRALYDRGLIDVAVIVTRTQGALRELGRTLAVNAGRTQAEAKKVLGTTTTTNTDKLRPRMSRGDAGGAPLLAVAICDRTWAGEGVEPPSAVPLVDVAGVPEDVSGQLSEVDT